MYKRSVALSRLKPWQAQDTTHRSFPGPRLPARYICFYFFAHLLLFCGSENHVVRPQCFPFDLTQHLHPLDSQGTPFYRFLHMSDGRIPDISSFSRANHVTFRSGDHTSLSASQILCGLVSITHRHYLPPRTQTRCILPEISLAAVDSSPLDPVMDCFEGTTVLGVRESCQLNHVVRLTSV